MARFQNLLYLFAVLLAVAAAFSALSLPHKEYYGKVKSYNFAKGYGYITPEDYSADVYVPQRAIHGDHKALREGQNVRYFLVKGPKGPQAEHVDVIERKVE